MQSRHLWLWVGVIAIAVGCITVYAVYLSQPQSSAMVSTTPRHAKVIITEATSSGLGQASSPRATIAVEVADTAASREQGLSGRTSLPKDGGMLFMFPTAGNWGFWMKDMRFALDIVYASPDGTIITLYPDVSPDSYPKAFYPSAPAAYVLEVPAGYAKSHGIAVGQKIVVQ